MRRLAAAKRDATLLWIKEQEDAGVDIITEGEQSPFSCMASLGKVEASTHKVKMGIRNNRYDAMVPGGDGPLKLKGCPSARGALLRAHSRHKIKITMPGPMTIVDTLSDNYYGDKVKLVSAFARTAQPGGAKADGIDVVQFDEPAFNVHG